MVVFVVGVVVAAVAVEGDDNRRAAVLCVAVSFPAAFACGGLCHAGGDGALVNDLHAGTPVFSAPPAAALSDIPPLPLSSPPPISPPLPPLLHPPLPPLLPAVAAARPPGGVLVIAVQVAALILPLPAWFFSMVIVAGGERGRLRCR